MIAVAIVGILAVISGVSVSRFRHAAKRAEVTNNLGKMAHATAAQYSNRRFEVGVNSFGADDRGTRVLCGSASTSVPSNVTSIKGTKHQSKASEWSVDVNTPNTGFSCLRFSVNLPQYYQYQYVADRTSGRFTARANGDLDGDGITSTFQLVGQATGSDVNIAPSMAETTYGVE